MSRHSAINRFGRSTNPAFSRGFDSTTYDVSMGEKMTLDGAVNKTGILLALCFSGAFIGWNIPALIWPVLLLGLSWQWLPYLEIQQKLDQLHLYMLYPKVFSLVE